MKWRNSELIFFGETDLKRILKNNIDGPTKYANDAGGKYY